MTIQHRQIPDAQLHETKGASTSTAGQILVSSGGASTWDGIEAASSGSATKGQVLVADGGGNTSWGAPGGVVRQGIYDYNDLATATTPIALTTPGTQYELPNDGAGAFTNLNYTLPGLPNIWSTSSNRFDFNNGEVLKLGDTVDIRFDFEVTTTTANTAVEFDLELGVGSSPYQLVITPFTNFKSSGTYKVIRWLGIYMGDTNTLNNPGRVLAQADTSGATVKVNGWYVRALTTI